MPFKLVVHHAEAPPETYVFDQERVTIGRGSDNDLPLPDVKRVVSKEHAAITQAGPALFITDLGSKNFTYLDEERLPAQRPHEIRPGGTVRIGDYELTFEIADAPSSRPLLDDRTMFDMSFVNPFEDGAQLLAAALRDLHNNYGREAPSRRDDALGDALRGTLGADGEAALRTVLRVLDGGPPSAPGSPPAPTPPAPVPSAPPPSTPPPSPPPPSAEDAWASPWTSAMSPPPSTPSPRPAAPAFAGGADRAERVLEAALRAMAQLIPVPWQFRHEFIGQTIMQAEETAFLYAGEAALRRHLLDPSASEAEAADRLARFRDAADDVGRHLMALLDGYRASAQEGAVRLIDQLHPDELVAEAARTSALCRLVPPLAKAQALDRLRDRLTELRSEDWVSIEQRTYRPAFTKAYLARMTASR